MDLIIPSLSGDPLVASVMLREHHDGLAADGMRKQGKRSRKVTWPMEMRVSLPFFTVLSWEAANFSMSFEGEYPGNRMKNSGVEREASAMILPASKASCTAQRNPVNH